MPEATGNVLGKNEAAEPQSLHPRGERGSGFKHQIVGRRAAGLGVRTINLQSDRGARLQPQRVANIGECDQAFEFVIAVSTATEHAQSQIDLGERRVDEGSSNDRHRVASRRRRFSSRT